MEPAVAANLLSVWAATVNAVRPDFGDILDGRCAFVGSILFQYREEPRALAAMGILLMDMAGIPNPQRTTRWLTEYAERHPEFVGLSKIRLLPADVSGDRVERIVLERTFDTSESSGEFVKQIHILSKQAFAWRNRHNMAAIRSDP